MEKLRRLPGIGLRLALDFFGLGTQRVSDLRPRNPESLYTQLNALRRRREDPCVLYAFRCAVYFAREPKPDPERLKWWSWKDAVPPRKTHC